MFLWPLKSFIPGTSEKTLELVRKSLLFLRVVALDLALFLVTQPIQSAMADWSTDKWDVRAEIESGGWKTTYFEEIHSETIIQGTLAGYFGGQAGFSAWFANWLNAALRNFSQSLSSNYSEELKQAAEDFLWDIMDDILQGTIPSDSFRTFGSIQIKAGVAEYHGCNTLFGGCVHPDLPSLQAYVAIRTIPGLTPEQSGWTGFRVCNTSGNNKIWLALSHWEAGTWISEGWWGIPQGECRIPLNNINNRYIYYYAFADGSSGDRWPGLFENSAQFCITPHEKFTIRGSDKTCSSPNEKFILGKMDVGDNDSFTLTLR